jgi:tetratricopeptide (TPR) repeat protein
VLAYRPADPEGLRRELGLLIEAGVADEAIRVATRLRDLGFGTPTLLLLLGDLRAAKGDVDGAKRAYSEIAENNAWDPAARRMLGDVFLRHGWFEDAYRQYGTLLFLSAGDPAAIVRFARAAAGAGRTDEALRVLRGIFELALPPSASDPREWARLWSADVAVRLLAASGDDPEKRKALVRSIKRSEAFRDAGTLYLLTWQDLGASLSLRLVTASGAPAAGNGVVAGDTGLASVFSTAEGTAPVVERAAGGPSRAVAWHLAVVTFDGKEFRVSERTGDAPVVSAPIAPRVVRGKSRAR